MAASTLYERDFYAWTREQAAALRRLADARWNGPLDLENLAEEIEDMGSDRLDAVLSQLERLLRHQLKLEHSAAPLPRRQWLITIDNARYEIGRRLSRSIHNVAETELPKLYALARRNAARELLDDGERKAADALPTENPYSLDLLLDEARYPANRHGLVDEI